VKEILFLSRISLKEEGGSLPLQMGKEEEGEK